MGESRFPPAGIETKSFGHTSQGVAALAFVLSNGQGASVEITNYGATITRLLVPDKAGRVGDVVLGFDNLSGYEKHTAYFGCVAGRVANRIARGTFVVDGRKYSVPVNNGPNSLHGGLRAYDKRIWKADASNTPVGPAVRLTLVDPDGSEGYPGTVNVTVTYTLTGDNDVRIEYHATTDKPTPINLTNHSYFNLKDGGSSGIGGHVMKLYATQYTPVDPTLIPTGRIDPVRGTPLDFTSGKPIGRDLQATGGDPYGYDHNLVLDSQDASLAKAADVYEPDRGRHMQVWTTEPGVQLYTANYLDGSFVGKTNIAYQRHSAFCLETQHYPDSINHPNFPSTLLRPGQAFRSTTEYRFSTAGKLPF